MGTKPRGHSEDLVGRALASPMGAINAPAFYGYDGTQGAGIYAFNQGHMGTPLYGPIYGGTVMGGRANPNGLSYNGEPVLAILSVNSSTESSQDSSVSLAWVAPGVSMDALDKVVFGAMDVAAGWKDGLEAGGLVNSKLDYKYGPPDGRFEKYCDPGTVTSDTIADFHFHLLVRGSSPWQFSDRDRAWMNAPGRTNLIHYLGVLDAPPGQFTVFRQMPGQSQPTLIRGDPWSHFPPGG